MDNSTPDIKIAITTTLKAPKSITSSFINYHLNIGIDHLYLFFDNPNDPSIPIYVNHPNITVIRCTAEHWKRVGCNKTSDIEIRQTLNADLAFSLSKQSNIDWIAHIDVDELIYTEKQSIKSILSKLTNSSVSFLSLPPFEAIPKNIKTPNPFTEINTFKVLKHKNSIQETGEASEKLNSVLFLNEYFRGHTGGKSFTKTNSAIKSLKIHKPQAYANETLKETSIENAMLLHFDCYDYKSWFLKWERRYNGSAKFTGRENRNRQFNKFKKHYETGNQEDLLNLYKKLHIISEETIEKLKRLGYAKSIRISKNLFDHQLYEHPKK